MKKETIIAISLGVGTGIAIAVLIIFNTQKNNTLKTDSYQQATITPQITFEPKKTEPLLITAPKDGATTNDSEITLTGKAPRGATLIFQSATNEIAIKTTSSEFSTKFQLNLGENRIKISQYLDKTIDARQLTIYRIAN